MIFIFYSWIYSELTSSWINVVLTAAIVYLLYKVSIILSILLEIFCSQKPKLPGNVF
jgi:hypothetical protein